MFEYAHLTQTFDFVLRTGKWGPEDKIGVLALNMAPWTTHLLSPCTLSRPHHAQAGKKCWSSSHSAAWNLDTSELLALLRRIGIWDHLHGENDWFNSYLLMQSSSFVGLLRAVRGRWRSNILYPDLHGPPRHAAATWRITHPRQLGNEATCWYYSN